MKFLKDTELWLLKYGIFRPKEIVEVDKEKGKEMIETGYFKEVKEVKNKKKKGVDD